MGKTIDGINYGPLGQLIGQWRGDQGLDVSPEPTGEDQQAYREELLFEAIGDVTNAETQTLAALRYHQVVTRLSDNKVFHNETGYLVWDEQSNQLMQSLTIPRGLSLVAGGTARADDQTLEVRASEDDEQWPISQSPFLRENAKTQSFHRRMTISYDLLTYEQTMWLEIYNKTFKHIDRNELHRV